MAWVLLQMCKEIIANFFKEFFKKCYQAPHKKHTPKLQL